MIPKETLVCVVDDDDSVRKGLARLLKSADHNVETFASAREFLERAPHPGPCCLVLDIRMPGLSGLDLQEELSKANLKLPIIFLTGHGNIPMSVKAMKKGAVDFLTKPVNDGDLLEAIEGALVKDERSKLVQAGVNALNERAARLTPRELDVFKLVVTGMLNKQIAGELGISEKTVKVHRGRVMQKMEADSLAQLVRIAERIPLQ